MIKSIFKSILAGVLFGALVFFAFRVVIIFLLIGAIMKLMGGGNRRHRFMPHRMAFADNIRNMSEEEYQSYKTNFGKHCMNPNQKPSN